MYKTFICYAQWFWENFVIGYPGAILLGGVAGGIVAAVISLLQWRGTVARHLLSEALRIQAMVEAWIVVGDGWKTHLLNRNNLLPTTKNFSDDGPLALYPVEIRAILDRPLWNSPENQFYTFIEGRRTWIIRAKLVPGSSYGEESPISSEVSGRPAILSSRALEELCGCIEEVVSAGSGFPWLLSRHSLEILRIILPAVAGQDRIEVFGSRLSDRAQRFLKKYRSKHPELLIFCEQKDTSSV
jgi:hypothetical protein